MLRMDAGFNQYLENPENQQRPEYDNEYWQAARAFHDNTTKLPTVLYRYDRHEEKKVTYNSSFRELSNHVRLAV